MISMNKSAFIAVSTMIVSLMLTSCGEKNSDEGENVEVSIAGIDLELPSAGIKYPLPFSFPAYLTSSEVKKFLPDGLKRLGYEVQLEYSWYSVNEATDQVRHQVGDPNGRLEISAFKKVPGDFRQRNEWVYVQMIGDVIIQVVWMSEIEAKKERTPPGQPLTNVSRDKLGSASASVRQDRESKIDVKEVALARESLGLPIQLDGNGMQTVSRCISRLGSDAGGDKCTNGIFVSVYSDSRKIRRIYHDRQAESQFWRLTSPNFQAIYVDRYGQPDESNR